MRKTPILGTPITPAGHLAELAGRSFCVAFSARDSHLGDVGAGRQLDRILEVQDPAGLLLVDNGAFSAFTQGTTVDWFDGFAPWAAAIAKASPAAVIVIPDVIDGDAAANDELMHEFMAEAMLVHGIPSERLMPVWHAHESLERLAGLVESGFAYIAIGSSGEFWNPQAANWSARIAAAFATIDELVATGAYVRPWIHMMRAQSQQTEFDFDSADSTNVARNHSRYKGAAGHVAAFADRIEAKIAATADGVKRVDTPAEVVAIIEAPAWTPAAELSRAA